MVFKGYASTYNAKVLNSLTMSYNLKILSLQLAVSIDSIKRF